MRELVVALAIGAILVIGVFLLPLPNEAGDSVQRTESSADPSEKKSFPDPAASPAPLDSALPPISPIAQNVKDATTPATVAVQSGAVGAAGNPETGRQVFRKCQACHSMHPGKNSVGPSLAEIVGKPAAADPVYNYSAAMRAANLTWDLATLDAYLLDPQKVVPGNKMPFPGLKTENERRDILAFLATPPAGVASQSQAKPTQDRAKTSGQAAQPTPSSENSPTGYVPEARFTLRSGIAEGRMVYIGVEGSINGQVNPVLSAVEGQMVQIVLLNGEGAEHDIVFPDQGARSQRIIGRGASTSMSFRAGRSGDFVYYCDVPGHRLAGMEGKFLVTPAPPAQTVVEANISLAANDLPPPIGIRPPQTVKVDLLTTELEGRLAEGTTFGYWTFNGKVPGPFIRVRVGDTVEVSLKNSPESTLIHSVDFHAATGPGGGAAATQANPGDVKAVRFKALVPGLYVYHCATPMVAHHIANGMYGLILVEPESGLPPVDREFYVMQGEIYTEGSFGHRGSQEFSVDKLLHEQPEYFVFNGSVGALSKLHPLEAKVGETVRIFFGVGGPNFTSSFHVIGEIFDRVYSQGGILSEPLKGIQTTTVPAGGAVIVEFQVNVPGNFVLVDHALSRAERGLVGILHAEGPSDPAIFDGKIESGSH